MHLKLSDYDYSLPRELIAQRPLPRRDASRMMVLRRDSQTVEHRFFPDFKSFLRQGDLVVLNDTRVVPARRFSDDEAIEFLFLEKIGVGRWKCLVKPGRKMRVGATTAIEQVTVKVEQILPEGERVVSLSKDIDLFAGGSAPLPPYIGRSSDAEDETRYQTVFARTPGAVAAPTAGLHFTEELLNEIPHAFVTLHVGPGTFLPVKAENIADHQMHPEWFSISAATAEKINNANRVVTIGTTTVRVLESVARNLYGLKQSSSGRGRVEEQCGSTDLFIYPPFEFHIAEALLTNFHLPKSTLLMLVSAFAGRDFLLRAYDEAIRERYRFFSYGDCMLIL